MLRKLIALLLIIIAIYWSFSALMPSKISTLNADKNTFSTERALVHLAAISQRPHYVGSPEHDKVQAYIVKQLQELGLETQIQEGYSISKWGNMAKPKNILARIKGREQGKALMLLSHYDSSPHSSLGASDAGSGVVTILEGLRAYLSEGKTPKNDLIIGITDAEELGLNGADLFVNQHPWSKDVGLVLNFEARGSGGPSYMLIETNGGNANLMKEFVAANPKYPVANSLAYSIYKMLPNDTDLTVFRRDGDIEGFNFAFIDDHFDYHTANDSYERLDRNTLEHQGSYLMPLLHHFSEANLNNLKSQDDNIYVNMPLFGMVTYPYTWIFPMLFVTIILFFGLVFYGIKKRQLNGSEIGRGFVPLFGSLLGVIIIGYVLWELLKSIYPEYSEILHGFTYNGHTYIAAFAMLALAICFWFYHKFYKPGNTASMLVAPLTLWIIVSTLVAIKLNGASFFIIPVLFGLISLFVLMQQKEPNLILMALLSFPVLFIMSPFIKMFPVGLGFYMGVGGASISLKVVSMVLVVLIFGLLLPVFGFFKHKKRWSYGILLVTVILLLSAHFNSGFTKDNPKPNSLVYALNADDNTAVWATYDDVLDDWTKNFIGDDPDAIQETGNTFGSKYGTGYSFTKSAPVKQIQQPFIDIKKDTIIGELRHINISISPQRPVNRIELFAKEAVIFKDFNINGVDVYKKDQDAYAFENRWRNRLFSFYVSNNDSLNLTFSVPKEQKTIFTLYEASFDLLENVQFTVPKRQDHMIPKPFVLNDAVMMMKTIVIE